MVLSVLIKLIEPWAEKSQWMLHNWAVYIYSSALHHCKFCLFSTKKTACKCFFCSCCFTSVLPFKVLSRGGWSLSVHYCFSFTHICVIRHVVFMFLTDAHLSTPSWCFEGPGSSSRPPARSPLCTRQTEMASGRQEESQKEDNTVRIHSHLLACQ